MKSIARLLFPALCALVCSFSVYAQAPTPAADSLTPVGHLYLLPSATILPTQGQDQDPARQAVRIPGDRSALTLLQADPQGLFTYVVPGQPADTTVQTLQPLLFYAVCEGYTPAELRWQSNLPLVPIVDQAPLSVVQASSPNAPTGDTPAQEGSTLAGKETDKQQQKPTTQYTAAIPNELPRYSASAAILPGAHPILLNVSAHPGDTLRLSLRLHSAPNAVRIPSPAQLKEPFMPLTLEFMMQTPSISRVIPSPSGSLLLVQQQVAYGPESGTQTLLLNHKGQTLATLPAGAEPLFWAPAADTTPQAKTRSGKSTPEAYYYARYKNGKRQLYRQTAGTYSAAQPLLEDVPQGALYLSPRGDYLLSVSTTKGDPKDSQVIRFRDPNDRMPSWRNGVEITLISLPDGFASPILKLRSARFLDWHPTEPKLLLALDTTDWSTPPFELMSLVEVNYQTAQLDTLFDRQPDIYSARYADATAGRSLVVIASPNSFGGVGNILPNGSPANSFEQELFWVTLPDNAATTHAAPRVECLSKEFAPSVAGITPDGHGSFYLPADDGAKRTLFHLNPKTRRIEALAQPGLSYVKNIASCSRGLYYIAKDATHADRLYFQSFASHKNTLIWDLDAQKMSPGYVRPEMHSWQYTAADGTPIDAWYYLPPFFDPTRSYPMLVYYYGGTSPTTYSMEGSYSLPMYAAQGYVVLTLNPSGTTGYGQAFSARHLNAWGEPTAREILAATRTFCSEHPYVNPQKIGCFGASYGGFMTQYLQTVDTLFAAAVSHAGISSISNYWGSGYWGAGYNTTAAYGSYPWNRRDIYVDRSPLFNADKIHTPLLLLHGDSDTNVPTAESLNLYTALKILGREVELILFTGQDHFISEPERRIKWTHSIMAWFQRFLKDDPSWWQALYPGSMPASHTPQN